VARVAKKGERHRLALFARQHRQRGLQQVIAHLNRALVWSWLVIGYELERLFGRP